MTTERTKEADQEQTVQSRGGHRPQPVAGQRYETNLELILAGPPIEPLKTVKIDPDPKGALAAVFGRLREGEYAEVHVDRREIPLHRAEKVRAYWAKQVTAIVGRGELSEPETQGSRGAGEVATRGLQVARLKQKLDPTEPLFECQILLHASSDDPARATGIVLGLYTAMGAQFSGANKLGVYGNQWGLPRAGSRWQIPGLKFFSTDAYPWRKWWFHYRRTTGLFWPSRPSIIAGFEGLIRAFSFPWSETTSDAPVTSGGTIPAPPGELPKYDESEEIA